MTKTGVKTRKLDDLMNEEAAAAPKEEPKAAAAPPKEEPKVAVTKAAAPKVEAPPRYRVLKDCRIAGGVAGGYMLRAGKIVGPATGYDITHLESCGASLEKL